MVATMTTDAITIVCTHPRLGNHLRVVEADIAYGLAVHEAVSGGGYVVTHVASGRAVPDGDKACFRTRSEAEAFRLLLRGMHDWSKADPVAKERS